LLGGCGARLKLLLALPTSSSPLHYLRPRPSISTISFEFGFRPSFNLAYNFSDYIAHSLIYCSPALKLITNNLPRRCSQTSYPTASTPALTTSQPNPSSSGNPAASPDASRSIWRALRESVKGSRSNRHR
jgi:hypothetical protein